nr:immunity protein YezG family protein [uncultured Leptotrichia sp.]
MEKEFFEKQNELITAIVQQVSDAIPGRWENFYLNAEISDNLSGGVYFFFNIEKNKNYIYCEDIPDIYNVYEEEYEERRNGIYKLSQKLKEVFIKHNLKYNILNISI